MADKRIVTVDYLNSEGLNKDYINNTFANALKGSKSGSEILIDDVSPVTHEMGVKVKSKNLLPYPYTETTKTQNGITFTDNGDGSITISGKAKRDTYFYLCTVDFGSKNMWNEVANDNGYYVSGCKHFFYNGTNKASVILVPSGTDYSTNPITVKPQIELGTTATDYTPYVPDLTAVKVSRCGKNLFDSQLLLAASGWSVDENGVYSGLPNPLYTLYRDGFPIAFKPGLTYTVSFYAKADLTADNEQSLYIGFKYTDGTSDYLMIDSTEYKLYKKTSTKDVAYMYVTFNLNYTTYIKDFMLEIGTTVTGYEPYNGAEYTPNADGTVEGVTSLYPNTILMTDTDGVIIDCEYNRDINKAFAELQQAIISLGGNV